MKKETIIISTIKSWNIQNAQQLKKQLQKNYNIVVLTKKEQLNFARLKKLNPKYIFFPHWSWIIPEEIYSQFNCIVFHMTDLPFGRGGSPLQNLIIRKIFKTKISALRVVRELDAGDIYLKIPLDLKDGSAEEIYQKASNLIFRKMIPAIIRNNPRPRPQKGKITIFKRRTAQESNILSAELNSPDALYHFIRMLDAEGYPKAFIEINNVRISLSMATKQGKKIQGRFEIENQ